MTARREALAELDQLTTALRDGADELGRRLAAVMATVDPARPRRRRSAK